jgi:hypothetical protein
MPKGMSLHIGLNEVDPDHYAGWSGPLNACEADAEDLQALAASVGYETEILRTDAALRATVRGKIAAAAAKLAPGDTFFLSYSGHGAQLEDENGDELDGADETWCLYDGELLDDELHVLWASFAKGVRVLVLSDSCHSGTVTKMIPRAGNGFELATVQLRSESVGASGPRYRAAPMDVVAKTYRRNRAFYDEIKAALPKVAPTVRATVRLISGCQDNQLSMDGAFNGLFTGTLLRVWNDGRFKGNYRQFHRAILGHMPADQTPNHFIVGASSPDWDAAKPFALG